ncbi:MAG: helix-turn-helix transcriptional regulator [Candidatus Bipolaricaulota bacterium]|nr:MAG: helix-turn-helix transcriptional regulator [Candidatus Bipolaricaulota bacterium]
MPQPGNAQTKITVEKGTAYDFLSSLLVLHAPKKFALRGAWASGMLARLSPDSRETLGRAVPIVGCPVQLVPSLPEPKDVETLLWHLGRWDPTELLEQITCSEELRQCGCKEIFSEVADRGRWTSDDRERLQRSLANESAKEKEMSDEKLDAMLDLWADARGFGEAYLAALRNYQDVFFHEEEKRIAAAIATAAERAAEQAKKLPLPDLIEEISGGLRYEDLSSAREVVLAPSYWIAPLLIRMWLDPDRLLFVFGARAASDSIVPGETVPDGLIRALKALSDPTRLRILRLVNGRPMGAAELARTLRLRTPTMLHHLHALRLSGLIQIRIPDGDSKQKALFSLRPQAVRDVASALDAFLRGSAAEERVDAEAKGRTETQETSQGG